MSNEDKSIRDVFQDLIDRMITPHNAKQGEEDFHTMCYNMAYKYIPCGSQTLSKSYEHGHHSPYFPAHIIAGYKSRMLGTDGKSYLDFICGLGAVTLGYGNIPQFNSNLGPIFSLSNFTEPLLARLLVEQIPCAEQIRFVKTGSEACQAAVRIARIATGRDKIVVVGYHGWHDWYAASRVVEESPGIPEPMRTLVEAVPYNDVLAIRNALRDPNVAAVMMEPTRDQPPSEGYLEKVKHLVDQAGSLLIFDEMLCGFRWALSGGQEFFNVTPDLAVFGKGVANGAPMAFVVGPQKLMQYAWTCSGTFSGDAYGIDATFYTLGKFYEGDVIAHMWGCGTEFQQRFNRVIQKHGVAARIRCEGYPVHPVFRGNQNAIQSVVDGLAKRHVLVHPKGCNMMHCHTEDDVKEMETALDATLSEW